MKKNNHDALQPLPNFNPTTKFEDIWLQMSFWLQIVRESKACEANNYHGIGWCGGREDLFHIEFHKIKVLQLIYYPFELGGQNVCT